MAYKSPYAVDRSNVAPRKVIAGRTPGAVDGRAPVEKKVTRRVAAARSARLVAQDPLQIVTLARSYTEAAVRKLAHLMENGDGDVPPAVQMRCAEILIERGYGKAPQAIELTAGDGAAAAAGLLAMSIQDRIAGLLAARAGGQTIDLEASQISEGKEAALPAQLEGGGAPKKFDGLTEEEKHEARVAMVREIVGVPERTVLEESREEARSEMEPPSAGWDLV